MNFDFSDDQKLLKDQAAKFLADKCKPEDVRKILSARQGRGKAMPLACRLIFSLT